MKEVKERQEEQRMSLVRLQVKLFKGLVVDVWSSAMCMTCGLCFLCTSDHFAPC